MKVGIPLDGTLCDTAGLKEEWSRRLGDDKYLSDEPFWGALKPYDDVAEFGAFVLDNEIDLYVFVERPKSLMLVSRSWLRKSLGFALTKDHVVMQAIKRFDCRLLHIPIFVDSDPGAIENLKMETVLPISAYHLDRSKGQTLAQIARRIVEDHEEVHGNHS